MNWFLVRVMEYGPDIEEIKKTFFEFWPIIEAIGIVNFSALVDRHYSIESSESVVALWLLGRTYEVIVSGDEIPCNVFSAWESAEGFLRYQMSPKGGEG